jgi:PPP family 3-phenylpropionic acid transporter
MPALPAPLALSLFYMTSFAVLGAYLPYFNLYLSERGFSGAQIGVVSALLPLCGTLVPTAGGMLADRLGRRRDLVALSSLLALLAFALLPGVRSFPGVALVIAAYATLRAPALPLVEATAMEVSEAGGPHYGRMRAWGSAAFILVSVAAGPLVQARGVGTVVALLIVLLALNLGAALLLPRDPLRTRRPALAGGLRGVVLRPRVLGFLAACVLMQASHAPYYVFYSIHLEEAGYRPRAIGLLWGVAVACEVIAMLRMPAILKRFGTLPVIAGCLLLASARWWICAATVEAPAMALAQSLHAASFAAFHVAAVTHTHRLFGEERRASGQAIYGSATYGAGNVLGMLFSGLLYESAGMRPLFLGASWTALLGGLLVLAASPRGMRPGRGI